MNLTLETLHQSGAFTGAPVKKDIEWMQGETPLKGVVYVRRLSYVSVVEDFKAKAGAQDAVAGRMAASICDADGKPIFTAADITGDADPTRGPLDPNLTMAFLAVIGEVNGLGKTKPSPKKKKSGTNSSSTASVEEPLPKPSET
ncbi:phage tail protein [Aestuariicella hydrocarbonica]|uniref:Phage tail protein n=1 Tax=Pseudomaricurvus hydrocarbonicus TaxID=1470433 RepID=A0A9E5JSA4_9GAMM|nr:phage tail assembly chaperone family protein, TAC [Aestuariicella hydrocarbonica]NHO64618.1 phage tail protein [Aestuariicella hydrocarbonica]